MIRWWCRWPQCDADSWSAWTRRSVMIDMNEAGWSKTESWSPEKVRNPPMVYRKELVAKEGWEKWNHLPFDHETVREWKTMTVKERLEKGFWPIQPPLDGSPLTPMKTAAQLHDEHNARASAALAMLDMAMLPASGVYHPPAATTHSTVQRTGVYSRETAMGRAAAVGAATMGQIEKQMEQSLAQSAERAVRMDTERRLMWSRQSMQAQLMAPEHKQRLSALNKTIDEKHRRLADAATVIYDPVVPTDQQLATPLRKRRLPNVDVVPPVVVDLTDD